MVILQSVPHSLNVKELSESVCKVPGILGLHELHIWQLDDVRFICTAHIVVELDRNFTLIAAEVKKILHGKGIHNVTIQPEFALPTELIAECTVACKGQECAKRVCCPEDAQKLVVL
jgi:zinc transporter 1